MSCANDEAEPLRFEQLVETNSEGIVSNKEGNMPFDTPIMAEYFTG